MQNKSDGDAKTESDSDHTHSRTTKKCYRRPQLRTFGALHSLTQGTGGMGNDGGGVMNMA